MDKFGIGYETMVKINPRIIHASVSGITPNQIPKYTLFLVLIFDHQATVLMAPSPNVPAMT